MEILELSALLSLESFLMRMGSKTFFLQFLLLEKFFFLGAGFHGHGGLQGIRSYLGCLNLGLCPFPVLEAKPPGCDPGRL
jgi:hypothetical protein